MKLKGTYSASSWLVACKKVSVKLSSSLPLSCLYSEDSKLKEHNLKEQKPLHSFTEAIGFICLYNEETMMCYVNVTCHWAGSFNVWVTQKCL